MSVVPFDVIQNRIVADTLLKPEWPAFSVLSCSSFAVAVANYCAEHYYGVPAKINSVDYEKYRHPLV
jgi:hypothetical protein